MKSKENFSSDLENLASDLEHLESYAITLAFVKLGIRLGKKWDSEFLLEMEQYEICFNNNILI